MEREDTIEEIFLPAISRLTKYLTVVYLSESLKSVYLGINIFSRISHYVYT